MKYSKRTLPFIPVGHPEFKWISGADVQATWRKYGWQAPSGQPSTPVLRDAVEPSWALVRRVK